MAKISLIMVAIVAVCSLDLAWGFFFVTTEQWESYKKTYKKTYPSVFADYRARFNYATNYIMIKTHNVLYERRLRTYNLDVNKFTDMHFRDFKTLFPLARSTEVSNDKPPPNVPPAGASYDPRSMGVTIKVEDQGTECNSGWAYATAKSLEISNAIKAGNMNPASLSAQNLIDCAGRSEACTNQEPLAAFNYLTLYKRGLHFASDYNNTNNQSQPGMCTPPNNAQVVTLNGYSIIKNGNDAALKNYLSAGIPAVVEVNFCSFHLMHYSSGIFQQPYTEKCSIFMVAIGYGNDSVTGKNYWILQNSFGYSWGQQGILYLEMTPKIKLYDNAIFPSD